MLCSSPAAKHRFPAMIKVRFWFISPHANSATNSCGVLAGFISDSSFSVCGEVERGWLLIPAASKPAGLLSCNVFEWLSATLMFFDSADLLKVFCQVCAEMLRWHKDNPPDIILVFLIWNRGFSHCKDKNAGFIYLIYTGFTGRFGFFFRLWNCFILSSPSICDGISSRAPWLCFPSFVLLFPQMAAPRVHKLNGVWIVLSCLSLTLVHASCSVTSLSSYAAHGPVVMTSIWTKWVKQIKLKGYSMLLS